MSRLALIREHLSGCVEGWSISWLGMQIICADEAELQAFKARQTAFDKMREQLAQAIEINKRLLRRIDELERGKAA